MLARATTKDFEVVSYYREASKNSPTEDGYAINKNGTNTVAVCDGVSCPYSPSNPPLVYNGGLTGGQMVPEKN